LLSRQFSLTLLLGFLSSKWGEVVAVPKPMPYHVLLQCPLGGSSREGQNYTLNIEAAFSLKP
jgi:hypothetical protein